LEEEIKKENSLVSNTSRNNLVLWLNIDGEIVQFDKECQRLTGYTRTEALNKKVRDFLIPLSYVTKWMELFDSAVKNEDIGDFKIPLKTFDDEEVLISWSILPLENSKGPVRNICFIGKNLEHGEHKKNSKAMSQDNNKKRITYVQDNNKSVDNEMRYFEKKNECSLRKNNSMFKKDNKNINFGKNSLLNPDKCSTGSKKLLSLGFKKSVKKSEESNIMNKTVKDLSKKYEKLSEKLKELEKKDRKLELKNKLLEKNLKNLKTYMKKSSTIKPDKKSQYNQITKKDKYLFKKMPEFPRDSLEIKKKRESFELRIRVLDERVKELEKLEAQLLKDREIHDKRIAEFTIWKEKLFSLEAEIEKRRRNLVELDDSLRENLPTSSAAGSDFDTISYEAEDTSSDEKVVQEDYHEILDKIPQCAFIIQRGIVKQINSSFAELIGFETDEIVEKSLFDFIALEGLADIEKYYLGRLKGNDSSTYGTIFSTKDDSKIQVEVIVRSTTYNGGKAEIGVVKEMNDLHGDVEIPILDKEDKQEDVSTSTGELGETHEDTTIEMAEDRQEELPVEELKMQDTAAEEVNDKSGDAVTEEVKLEDATVEKTEEALTEEAKKSQEEIDAMIKAMKDKQK
jgi:PAS domain S-box-containing protein